MAETSQITTRRGMTVKLTDSSSPTPKTYTGRFDGNVVATAAKFEVVRGRDTNGDFIGQPRQGQQTGPSTVALDGMVFGNGGSTTDGSLADVLGAAFQISGLTTAAATGEQFVWASVEIRFPDVTSGGSTKNGATWVLNNVVIAPGAQVTIAQDGVRASFTLESQDANFTVTEI